MLRQFPGYTLSTLREESSELLVMLAIEALGRPDEPQASHVAEPWDDPMGGW